MIEVKDVSKSYKNQQVLHDISFNIKKGEIIGLIGPNGAGKTSLLNILALIADYNCGEYLIEENNTKENLNYYRSVIGYVPQDIALFEELSVADNLVCWSKYNSKKAKNLMHLISLELDFTEILNKKVKKLSGGMKRRLNVAIALINAPQILVMDEPMVGIDDKHCKLIFSYLKTLSKQGVTQVISSHSTEQLIEISNKILYLNNGKIEFFGDTFSYLSLLQTNHINAADKT
ncbi:MAG: ABC transporter ATP-binding protein [Eubacteriaceae bacterium]